jgi:transcriptional regulator with XRE-family HTH domain
MVAIVPVQSWMARMALGWGVRDLACAAEVSPATVKRFECGESLRVVTVEMIQRALENAGHPHRCKRRRTGRQVGEQRQGTAKRER